ncbi:hypothetical protein IHE33_12360 (plasmid) [Mycetohabitans endofungorum]|uniref:hypothetical protein n=1 Tax=Mycetohabitans endofungorum TaxID=417203 RepID=UPI0030CB0207
MKPQISQSFSNTIHKLPSPTNTSTKPNKNTDRHAAEPSAIDTGLFCGLFSRKHLSKEEREAVQWTKTKEKWHEDNKAQYRAMMKMKEKSEKKIIAEYDKEYKKWKKKQKINSKEKIALPKQQPEIKQQPKMYNIKTLDGVEPPLPSSANVPKGKRTLFR